MDREQSGGGCRAAGVGPLVALLILAPGCASTTTSSPSSPPPPAPSRAATTPTATTSSEKSSAQASAAPATEVNPPGDIPDNQVFVSYTPPGTRFRLSVPEGWARATRPGLVTFSDKLNSVAVQVVAAPAPPTVASVKATELPVLAKSVPKFVPGDVTETRRNGGRCVRITYQQDSAPDPVTGKVVRDAVERYEFFKGGRKATVTLSGPVKADNVDPWRIVSDSASWR